MPPLKLYLLQFSQHSTTMNLRVPWNAGNFLTSSKPVSCSRRTLHHGVSTTIYLLPYIFTRIKSFPNFLSSVILIHPAVYLSAISEYFNKMWMVIFFPCHNGYCLLLPQPLTLSISRSPIKTMLPYLFLFVWYSPPITILMNIFHNIARNFYLCI